MTVAGDEYQAVEEAQEKPTVQGSGFVASWDLRHSRRRLMVYDHEALEIVTAEILAVVVESVAAKAIAVAEPVVVVAAAAVIALLWI